MISAIKNIKRVFSQNGSGGGGSTTPNIQTVVSAATVTPTFTNDEVTITAQAVSLFLANPTGTPVDGKNLVIRIKDNGTAQAITYDTQYRAIGVTLPTTTAISKTIYLILVYNLTDTKWDVVDVSIEGAAALYDSGWIDYSATSTIVGWSSFTTKQIRYKIIGKQMFVQCNIDGISNSINASFTIPNNSINISEVVTVNRNSNNGVASSTFGMTRVLINQNIVTSFINNAGGTWTSSGSKFIECQFFIEIA